MSDPVARAHADALREAMLETVATKADIVALQSDMAAARSDLSREIAWVDRKIEIMSRDLIIKGAGGLVLIASLMIGLKLFG